MNPRIQKAVNRRTLSMSVRAVGEEYGLSGTDARAAVDESRRVFNDPHGVIRRTTKMLMHIRKREHLHPGLHKAIASGASCRQVGKAVNIAPSSAAFAANCFKEYAKMTKRTLKACLVDLRT